MGSDSTHWTAAVAAAAWGAFFLALIFHPALVKSQPLLAVVAIGGTAWWMVKARRTRRRERQQLAELEQRR